MLCAEHDKTERCETRVVLVSHIVPLSRRLIAQTSACSYLSHKHYLHTTLPTTALHTHLYHLYHSFALHSMCQNSPHPPIIMLVLLFLCLIALILLTSYFLAFSHDDCDGILSQDIRPSSKLSDNLRESVFMGRTRLQSPHAPRRRTGSLDAKHPQVELVG